MTERPFLKIVPAKDGCAYRKSDPSILVVQPAQDRAANDAPDNLGGARYGLCVPKT